MDKFHGRPNHRPRRTSSTIYFILSLRKLSFVNDSCHHILLVVDDPYGRTGDRQIQYPIRNQGHNKGGGKGKKERPVCTYCGFTRHIANKCYKLHGYPPRYKPKGGNKPMANQVSGNFGFDANSFVQSNGLPNFGVQSNSMFQNLVNTPLGVQSGF